MNDSSGKSVSGVLSEIYSFVLDGMGSEGIVGMYSNVVIFDDQSKATNVFGITENPELRHDSPVNLIRVGFKKTLYRLALVVLRFSIVFYYP